MVVVSLLVLEVRGCYYKEHTFRAWRDRSGVKNIICSSRRLSFDSHHQHDGLQMCVRRSKLPSGLHRHQTFNWCRDMHANQPSTHIKIKFKNEKHIFKKQGIEKLFSLLITSSNMSVVSAGSNLAKKSINLNV